MDIKTILACLVIINYSMGFFTYVIKKTQPTFGGINYWILSNFLIGTGYLLLFYRGQIPDFFSVVFGQMAFLSAGLLRIQGLSKFFGQNVTKLRFVLFGLLLTAYFAFFFYFTIQNNNQYVRTLLSGLVLSAVSVYTGILILKNKPQFNYNYAILASAFFIFSFIFLIRITSWLFFPSIRGLFTASFVNYIQFFASMIIDIVWTTMFFVIHNQRLNNNLNSSRKQYQLLFEHMNHAFVLGKIDLKKKELNDFEIVLGNSSFANYFNLNEKQLTGKKFSEIAPLHDIEMTRKYCRVAQTAVPLNIEYYSKTVNRYVKANAYCPDNGFVAIVIEDITEEKLAAIALQESEAKYRLLAENISDVIWSFNAKTFKINYISPTVYELTGFTALEVLNGKFQEQLINNEVFETIKASFIKGVNQLIKQLPALEVFRIEYHIPTKHNQFVWIEVEVKIMSELTNSEFNVIGIARNIDHRKRYEKQLQQNAEELKQANTDKDRFIAVLAHDLRSPFSVLLNYTEILLQNFGKYPIAKVETMLQYIKKTSHATYNLLEDILLWNRTKTGMQPFNPQWFEFGESCQSIVKGLSYACESKSIVIEYNEKEHVLLHADNRMIIVVLRNLLLNAIKFSYPENTIHLSSEIENQNLVVCIADSGVGIAPEDLLTLWDADTTKSTFGTSGERGSGFGLMICKDFINKHKGKIWAESTVGKGSKFYFSIPLKPNLA